MQSIFAGKRALVTGGSGTIGRAICRQLAAAGADIVFTYFSDHDAAAATRAELTALGVEPQVVRAHLGDETSTGKLIEAARAAGPLDIVVSNAASGVIRPATELTARHFDWCMDINARALFRIVTELARSDARSLADGGRIVAISSLGAVRAIPQYAAVGASKAALESLVRHFALELGARGITANVVAPGIVDSRALAHFPNRAQLLEVARARTPAGRICTADDVAGVVSFLCSPAAAMISGQTLTVDGGYSIVG